MINRTYNNNQSSIQKHYNYHHITFGYQDKGANTKIVIHRNTKTRQGPRFTMPSTGLISTVRIIKKTDGKRNKKLARKEFVYVSFPRACKEAFT